uniref:Uncharacterized protein n=1 Tax=Grammatophora oceanica TaxID=210454 RepID=A0A7S1Y405_9STRA|mmetsp:Transcript_17486/g.25880  ORF Transcript_17486/g.25880 Transcript_17486/m.25880 type:complete len:107 (+) Transcript_17486:49-369(+)
MAEEGEKDAAVMAEEGEKETPSAPEGGAEEPPEAPVEEVEEKSAPETEGKSACSQILLVILAIFLPPVSAFLTDGCSMMFWLNLLLTFLIFFPGMIHALWLIFRTK